MEKIRYYGFDHLRGLACLTVVFFHSQVLNPLLRVPVLGDLANIASYNIFPLAVPIFFQISLFLTYSKGGDTQYIIYRKLPQLLKIFGLWTFAGFIEAYWFQKDLHLSSIKNARDLVSWLLKGGVSWELYFLVSLMIITVLAALNQYLYRKTNRSIELQWLFLAVSSLSLYVYQFPLWHPFNFLPYIFSSLIVYQLYQNNPTFLDYKKHFKILIGLSILFVIMSAFEWVGMYDSNRWVLLPPYSRASLVLGGCLIFYIGLILKEPPKGLLLLVANYSLGIYCLHVKFITLLNSFKSVWTMVLPGSLKFLQSSLLFVIVLILSIATVKYLRNIKFLKQFT
ncbi:acyltransferase [Pannus brasiliensis CCIBt3594]|uniref:Acyltransferase n=1 Tax=Pannus brasiliensis CCIBt3594 TaxID=1427578 RepID=A0AAW9QYQ2_9CHRO